MTEDAVSRVRAAIAEKRAPIRKDLEHALREAFGLSSRQAKGFVSRGADAIGSEPGDVGEITERLQELERRLKL